MRSPDCAVGGQTRRSGQDIALQAGVVDRHTLPPQRDAGRLCGRLLRNELLQQRACSGMDHYPRGARRHACGEFIADGVGAARHLGQRQPLAPQHHLGTELHLAGGR